jgi:hypothetical protein
MTMAMKKSTSRFRSTDSRLDRDVLGQAEPQRTWTQMPEALRNVIDAERSRLMDAEAVLHCAVTALDAGDHRSATEPYYQSVINTARDLIVRSVIQLDVVALNETLRAVDAGATVPGEDESVFVHVRKHAVRESALTYLN